jgi:hypothetical protein
MTRFFRGSYRTRPLASAIGLALTLMISLLLAPAPALAQIDAGSIVGTVSDGQGGVLPGVTVVVTQEGTGFAMSDVTNGKGQYTFPNLKIGKYLITAELTGFKKAVRAGVQLHVGDRIQADFKLDVGAMTEEVTVSGEAPLLNTQTGDMGHVVDQKQLTDLPLLGRRYAELALLQTGVVPGGRQLAGLGEDTSFNANGNYGTWNNYTLDGADNNSGSTNLQERSAQVIQPPVDALEEFRIQTRTYSAEFGKSAGAVINASIKQGTNNFKGTIFGFLRDEKFNANTFENIAANRAKGPYNQYIGGFTAGGPIVKNKLFIFGDYQITRSDRAVSDLATVPTALMRQGNLSELSRNLVSNPFVPASCINTTTKVINPACFDPISARLINLYPQPNVPAARALEGQPGRFGAAGANYISNGILQNDVNSFDVRVDGKPGQSGKDSVFVRYSRYKNERHEPPVLGPIVSGDFNSDIFITGQSAVLGWSRALSNSMFSEVRAAWNKIQGDTLHTAFGVDSNKEYGITGIPSDPRYTGGLAALNIAGLSRLGGPSFRPQFQTSQVFQLSANTTWQKGSHSFKFGAGVRRDKVRYIDLVALNGAATFSDARYTGSGIGDFLLGMASAQRITLFHEAKLFTDGIEIFAQDSWRPTSKISVNYGFRYEYFTPTQDEDHKLTNIDAATGQRITAKSSGSMYEQTLVNPDKNNLAPRFSVSYSASEKLVMRAGFGIFYQSNDRYGSEAQMALNPPQLVDVNVTVPNANTAPTLILSRGFTTPTLANVNPALLQWRIQDPNQKTPIVYQFSVGPEYQMFDGTVLSVEYVGNMVRNGRRLRNLNQGQITGSTVVFPFAQYGYGTAFLEQIVTNGRSNYHALQSKLQRRMRGGLGFTASYTYSTAKADFLDHLSAGQGASGNFPQNAYDMGADYGPVAFDVPHRFVLSFVAELPAGKGRKKEFKGAAAILNNWSVNGILSLNSGRPFTATATDASNTGAGHQSRANCSGDAQPGSFDKTIDKWFDTSKFSQPTALTFGNCGSNTLRGPGQKSMNASIFRSFPLPNDRRIEFRAEAFNVFNWKNYALPGASVANTATFGRITSTLGDVREMQFAVKLYW